MTQRELCPAIGERRIDRDAAPCSLAHRGGDAKPTAKEDETLRRHRWARPHREIDRAQICEVAGRALIADGNGDFSRGVDRSDLAAHRVALDGLQGIKRLLLSLNTIQAQEQSRKKTEVKSEAHRPGPVLPSFL